MDGFRPGLMGSFEDIFCIEITFPTIRRTDTHAFISQFEMEGCPICFGIHSHGLYP